MRYYLLSLTLLLAVCASAQKTKTTGKTGRSTSAGNTATTTTTTNKAPVAKNMKDYAKTPQGLKRAQTYAKSFAASSGGTATKNIKYPDGTSLHLKMVKNPSFADQPTAVTAKVSEDKKIKPEKSTDSKGTPWTCVTDHVQLTAESTTFLNNDYSAQASHIYPGAMYTFDDFYNGSYKETTGPRYPLTITTDNPNIKGNGYVTIQDPNMATIRAGVDQLYRDATGPTANESLAYQMYQTSNDADESLMISGGASGYGISVSAGYRTSSQSSSLNLTIDAIKTLYTINCVPPDSGFFKTASIENTPNLMVMGSVNYGVRVLANLTVTFNSSQEEASFKASYSGWGISANVDLDQLSKNSSVSSTINCYVVGGPGNSTISFDKSQLKAQIQKILAGATYKNAMPVSYQFYDMAGDLVGSSSATDDFAERDCTPGAEIPRLESAYVTFSTGGDNKNQNDDFIMGLYPGNVPYSPAVYWNGEVAGYGSGPNSPEYPNNSRTTIQMYDCNKRISLQDFQKDGGYLWLHMEPHGTDTWDINSIQLTLNFSTSASQPQEITFSNITPVGSSNTDGVYYFGGDFKQR